MALYVPDERQTVDAILKSSKAGSIADFEAATCVIVER